MNDDQLITELDRMSVDATGNNSTFINENNELLDRYEGNPYGDEVPERSKVISQDCLDIVEADMPALARIFLGSGEIIKFKPNKKSDEEDVKEANNKTRYVDWQIRHQPWSFPVLFGFIKNAEIMKLSVVKYFIEETTEVEEHKKTGLSDEELAEYQDSLQGEDVESVEVVREEEGEDENQIVFKVERTKKTVKVINVPLENFRMSKNAESKYDAELIGDVSLMTRGELLSKGFSKDQINELVRMDEIPDQARLEEIRDVAEGGPTDNDNALDWASETVLIEDLYVRVDYDGDGIAERRHIMRGYPRVILHNEVFNHEPYALMSAILMPHKAIGKSRVELVAPTARSKTAILRGIQDNIYAVNAPRMAYNENVEQDDLLVIRPNGGIRIEGDEPPQNSLMPVTVPYMGDKALQVIQYWDQARAQTTGSLMASQGLDADQLGKETATRFEGVEDISEAKVELVARVMAETGFRQLYEGVAWLDANFQDTDTEIEVLGEELTINPRDWKYNHQINSKVGLGAADDKHLTQTMTGLWQIHQQLLAMNSPMTDEVKRFNILKTLVRSTGIPEEEEFFNNPEKPEELTLAQNEILTRLVQQLQAQAQGNPLAEAEQIKQQANLVKAQADAQIQTQKLAENQRQFNMEFAQKNEQFMKDLARQLAELQMKYEQSIPSVDMEFDPFTGLVEQLNGTNG